MLTENLKKYRKKAGFSQREMAEKLFMSQQGYAKYETGRSSPNPETLAQIAIILNCKMENLTGNESDFLNENKTAPKTTNILQKKHTQYETITEQEKTLLETFRSTTELGRQRIIQSALNIYDDLEKKDPEKNTQNLG